MNIINAIRSRERIKRRGWKKWFDASNRQFLAGLHSEDILATDWVTESMIKPPADRLSIVKDGDTFICYDTVKFVNLQESDCYAFGETREKALKNYLDKLNFNIKED